MATVLGVDLFTLPTPATIQAALRSAGVRLPEGHEALVNGQPKPLDHVLTDADTVTSRLVPTQAEPESGLRVTVTVLGQSRRTLTLPEGSTVDTLSQFGVPLASSSYYVNGRSAMLTTALTNGADVQVSANKAGAL